jgi:hypothetical protein
LNKTHELTISDFVTIDVKFFKLHEAWWCIIRSVCPFISHQILTTRYEHHVISDRRLTLAFDADAPLLLACGRLDPVAALEPPGSYRERSNRRGE